MKATIDVTTRQKGDQIRRGLQDPQVRAFMKVIETLSTLPSDRARERVLRFVDDKFAEESPTEYSSVFSD